MRPSLEDLLYFFPERAVTYDSFSPIDRWLCTLSRYARGPFPVLQLDTAVVPVLHFVTAPAPVALQMFPPKFVPVEQDTFAH